MLTDQIRFIESRFSTFVRDFYGIEPVEMTVEIPPRIEFGDLAFPFPFKLSKVLRKPPRIIAEETIENIGKIPGIERMEAAGAGFINIFFNRKEFLSLLYRNLLSPTLSNLNEKIIVEHTNINPNKAAHIGHLRNAILGDTFVRLLRESGYRVEVQNYIDNTGVQVADVVVGFHHLRGLTSDQIKQIPDPFDYYCWDLYAEVSDWYAQDESRLELRRDVLQGIEEADSELYGLAEFVSNRIVRSHINTMLRINVTYDVLPRESEILHLKFWEEAFRLLKEREAIHFVEEGPSKGCWVMQTQDESGKNDEEKIIVRSNGTVTYVGKDIAYQLWKFGLLGKTFQYQPFYRYADGTVIWVTTDEPHPESPHFGSGDRVFNVIDVRQSYLQRVVIQGLRSLGFDDEADRSTHFSYEMVALSPACCSELGIDLSAEDRLRSYVEVSGRKGLGVKADDLIDKLVENSLNEVNQRQNDLSESKRKEIARQIAVGALRYFMLKYTRNSVIAFDFSEALSFEGETGPYLQYSVVRSNNIFRKIAGSQPDSWKKGWRDTQEILWQSEFVDELLEDNDIWSLVTSVARIEEVVAQSISTLEIAGVAKHAFTLAQQLNLFYHKHHILSETDAEKQAFYLTVVDTARLGLLKLFHLLGIEVPERM